MREGEKERERALAVKFPGEGGGTFHPHHLHHTPPEKTEGDGEAGKRNKLSSPNCATPWKLKINKAVCVCPAVVGVAVGISVNTFKT